jgi:hypothetical protein
MAREEPLVLLHTRGWPIVVFGDRRWRWESDGRFIPQFSKRRTPCRFCGQAPTPEGHDPCLGTLDSVKNACCGHGAIPGYISYVDGTRERLTLLEGPPVLGDRP